jgi:hypothetical protein
MLEKMDAEVKAFEEELIQIAWAMRGSVSLNEAYALSPAQRTAMAELFKKNLEITKESGIAYF